MDIAPQTAAGKVLMHFCISLDGWTAPTRTVDRRPALAGVARD